MRKKSLLIIDDSQSYRVMLQLLFRNDYTIFEADNGQEGFNIAKTHHPDLILCDVMMPLKDGFACCQSLKKHNDTQHIPIILLTSLNEAKHIIKGLQLGIDDYMTKPCNLTVLKMKVDNLITSRERLKEYFDLLRSDQNNDSNPFLDQITQIIRQNMSETDFGVKQLADLLFTSPTSLYRKIKHTTQLSPIALIRKIRLERAAELLRLQSFSIVEVAETVGYNDVSSFRKHFMNYYGKAPLAYAKNK